MIINRQTSSENSQITLLSQETKQERRLTHLIHAPITTLRRRPKNGVENFLYSFMKILETNDISKAKQAAKRIKNLLFIQQTSNDSPLYDLPNIHRSIIHLLNHVETKASQEARKILVNHYYQREDGGVLDSSSWRTPREIREKTRDTTPCSEGFYYHATPLRNLEPILRSGQIKAAQSAKFGAFVATYPIEFFGSCFFALRKGVEASSPLSSKFSNCYGFSRSIPLNRETLAYIFIDQIPLFSIQELPPNVTKEMALSQLCASLQIKAKEWAQRDITILPGFAVRERIKLKESLEKPIPIHWGKEPYDNKIPKPVPIKSRTPFLPDLH